MTAAATVLESLAALADSVAADDIPADIVAQACTRTLDSLACVIAGVSTAPAISAYQAVASDSGEATLVGGPRRCGIAGAALANATALRALDFMDGHPGPYSCHPSLLIPAVLAAAEAHDRSGRDVARSIVLGYELAARLQLASGDPDITAHGWSGSTNLGLAVSFSVGTLLGLRGARLVDAMAIACVHAPTLDASGRGQMAESKAAVDGMVAMSAVAAVQLARAGMTGPRAAYDGGGGFVEAVAGRFDPDILLAGASRFRIVDCYTKVYNAVKCAQSAVAAALQLRDRVAGPGSVESITVYLAERDWRNQCDGAAARRRPDNRDTANHSVVYCVAAGLVYGDLQTAQFGPECLADERTLALIDATTIAADPDHTAQWPAANPATVEIRLRTGEVLRATVTHPPGHPRNPITAAQLSAKVRALVDTLPTEPDAAAIGQLITSVTALEEADSVRDVMALARRIACAER